MEIHLLPLWITSTASVVGVIYAIVRNGSRSKKQNEDMLREFKHELRTIGNRLDDPYNGLTAIKQSADEMKLRCTETSTRITEQVSTQRAEIDMLRAKKSRTKGDKKEI